jgi:hypothetical protein
MTCGPGLASTQTGRSHRETPVPERVVAISRTGTASRTNSMSPAAARSNNSSTLRVWTRPARRGSHPALRSRRPLGRRQPAGPTENVQASRRRAPTPRGVYINPPDRAAFAPRLAAPSRQTAKRAQNRAAAPTHRNRRAGNLLILGPARTPVRAAIGRRHPRHAGSGLRRHPRAHDRRARRARPPPGHRFRPAGRPTPAPLATDPTDPDRPDQPRARRLSTARHWMRSSPRTLGTDPTS